MRFSIEAEHCTLGALLVNPEKLDDVLEIVSTDDFYDPSNRQIFKHVCAVAETGRPIDAIVIAESMNDAGVLEAAGGLQYIIDIVQNTPSAANVKAYAHIVADRAMERRITAAGQRIAEIGEDDSVDVDSKLDQLHTELAGLERKDNTKITAFNDLLKSRVQMIDSKFRDAIPRGMQTGFSALDERYMGISKTAMWVVAGRPGQGKTAFAINVAKNIAAQGKDVLIFSLEMDKDELTDRLICAAGSVESGKIRTGKLDGEDWTKLSLGVQKLKDLNINIVDTPAIDIRHAKAIARKFNRVKPLGLIVIDYLQLMTDSRTKNRFDEVSSISREIKALAKTIGCPVMALSQLNRGVEKQGNKRPGMADLRESGQIEQDADIITFIYRDEYYYEDSPNKGTAELITAKFREGEVGTDILGAQLQYARFVNLDQVIYDYDWQERQKPKTGKRESFN